VFTDGHDAVHCELLWRFSGEKQWNRVPMEFRHNDHWVAAFRVEQLGRYQYTVRAWTDPWLTWQRDLVKRRAAGQDLTIDLQIGARLLGKEIPDYEAAMAAQAPPPRAEWVLTFEKNLEVVVDPVRARFSAWYEVFPRSFGGFRGMVELLPYVERLGFDILYLPPVHPVGVTKRKGKNNAVASEAGDVGSPWAIGASEGGHKAVNPELGTLADFDLLVKKASEKNIQIALDIAFQCSPDHPYVKQHPEWFRARPDGTIQYAENPPKKYQDIYPFDFESENWTELWAELKSVFEFWIGHGVTVFRVDNPHTKAFAFWEWCIADIKHDHPEAIFLAEAFTRPRPMHRLAKLGFSQSYTYFTWRNTAAELRTYLTELTSLPSADYFRPNFWPNTPDILHADLQHGGRAAFMARAVLAATLSSNWGMYGPAYELMEATPREEKSEEYLDSEKYQQRTWDLARADSLAPFIATINAARRDHPALQSMKRLVFHEVNSEWLLAYSKTSADGKDVILAVVNMDYHATRAGTLVLDLEALGIPADTPFEAQDLLDDATYTWRGARNWVSLDPEVRAAHLMWLRKPG
jgi:starch synthase (maltosyl-transferring)